MCAVALGYKRIQAMRAFMHIRMRQCMFTCTRMHTCWIQNYIMFMHTLSMRACLQVIAHKRALRCSLPCDYLVEAGNDHLLSGGLPAASASLGHGGGGAGDFARRHAAACEEAGAQLRYARTHDGRLLGHGCSPRARRRPSAGASRTPACPDVPSKIFLLCFLFPHQCLLALAPAPKGGRALPRKKRKKL